MSGRFDYLVNEIRVADDEDKHQRSRIRKKQSSEMNFPHRDGAGVKLPLHSTKLASLKNESNFLPKLLQRKLKYGGIVPTITLRLVSVDYRIYISD